MVFGFLNCWVIVGHWVKTRGSTGFGRVRAGTGALAALLSILLLADAAYAAQNGRLGRTSTGSISITLVKPASIQVRSPSEAVLSARSPVSASGYVNQCVNARLYGSQYTVASRGRRAAAASLAVHQAAVYRDPRACPGGKIHRFAVKMAKTGRAGAASVLSLTYRPE